MRSEDRPKRSCLRDDDDDEEEDEEEEEEEEKDEEACPGAKNLRSSPLALGTPAVRNATASWTSGDRRCFRMCSTCGCCIVS